MQENDDIRVRAVALTVMAGAMWVVRAIDTFRWSGHSIAGVGIVPRTWAGLYGIPVAPFIHASWPHLIANTVPLLVLGALVLLSGTAALLFVFFTTMVIGGIGTWLFGAGGSQHVGASGIVFGLFGYLVCRAFFDRRLTSVLLTLIVAVAYGTAMTMSLLPASGISWSGHFFGFVGGVVAARLRHPAAQTARAKR